MNKEDLAVSLARNFALIVAGVSLFAAQPGLAKTYKWVDENGVTQYTQTPPPKGDFKNIKAPPKPAIAPSEAKRQLQDKVDAYDERRTDAAKSDEEADKLRADTAKRQADCAQSKKNLEYFQSHSRIKYTGKDGNVTILPEEERQKKMATIRDNIKKLCQ
jgi:hypothetical protein